MPREVAADFGRRAAARDVKYYQDALETKVRAIFYNPGDFL
jgi:hypothetical protein